MTQNKSLDDQINQLHDQVWEYYHAHGRMMPWRENPEAYWVVVSEIMLQQTQVSRVMEKFSTFVAAWPDWHALAQAPLADVLRVWQGLGYNRRARYLHDLAKAVVNQHHGQLPQTLPELTALPGIGPNTAGAILAYAFNQPAVFIETNIRTVFIHHFFADAEAVSDRELLPLIDAALDRDRPREWYWALMDYGAHLKQSGNQAARRSRHHAVQSRFAGSQRQVRGQVIRLLSERDYSVTELRQAVKDDRLGPVLAALKSEGLIQQKRDRFILPN